MDDGLLMIDGFLCDALRSPRLEASCEQSIPGSQFNVCVDRRNLRIHYLLSELCFSRRRQGRQGKRSLPSSALRPPPSASRVSACVKSGCFGSRRGERHPDDAGD